MSEESFPARLNAVIEEKDSRVSVGIDPRLERIPPYITDELFNPRKPRESAAECYREFAERIIQAVEPVAAAIKFQLAFFEKLGAPGLGVLEELAEFAGDQDLLTVMDAKRGDIGSTAAAYGDAFLGEHSLLDTGTSAPFRCDALTVNPWLGLEALEPLIDGAVKHNCGLFVLLHTSNPGATELQERELANGGPLYMALAEAMHEKNRELSGEGYGPLGAVAGATYPEQLDELRAAVPSAPFLIPGYGAQGGGAEDVVGGFDGDGLGAVVNSSRGIIFHWQTDQWQNSRGNSEGGNFARAAKASAEQMRKEINRALAHTSH